MEVSRHKMVGYDAPQKIEPEQGNLRQHSSLVRNPRRKDIIEGGYAIGSNEQQPVIGQGIHIPDLAAHVYLKIWKFCSEKNGIEKFRSHDQNFTVKKRGVF